MPTISKNSVQHMGSSIIYGFNANQTIFATKGSSNKSVLISIIDKQGEITPIFFLNCVFRIVSFLWHHTNPLIFFTVEHNCVTAHQLSEDADNTRILLGKIEFEECITSISINKEGDIMLVMFSEKNYAKLLSLNYSEGSIKFSCIGRKRIPNNDEQIVSLNIFDNVYAFMSNDENGSITVGMFCKETGKNLQPRIWDEQDLMSGISVQFSPDGKFLVALSDNEIILYSFSKDQFALNLVSQVNFKFECICVNIVWHHTLPLLIGLFNENEVSVIRFYKANKHGLTQIFEHIFNEELNVDFCVFNCFAIFGSIDSLGSENFITINFEDLIHFPLKEMLMIRNVSNHFLQNDDLVLTILEKNYQKHLSFERFEHLMIHSFPNSEATSELPESRKI